MGMLTNIINAMEQVPVLVTDIFSKYMIPAILCCIVYLLVLFFSNKVFDVVRKLVVLALIGWICVGLYRYRGAKGTLAPVTLACTLLLVLFVIRLIIQIVASTKESITNRRIEKQALAKAAKRRGSWKMRQGRSGPAAEEPAAPAESVAADAGEAVDAAEEEENPAAERPLSRTEVQRCMDEMQDLKDKGVLTEQEFTRKKQELYMRLG